MDTEVINALEIAGIPKRYHDPNFKLSGIDNPAAKEMVDWAKNGGFDGFRIGQGRFVVGLSLDATDIFYLTVRLLIVKRFNAIVCPLPLLLSLIKQEGVKEMLEESDVICINEFYNSHYNQAYSQETLSKLEWWIKEHMLQGKGFMFQAEASVGACKWWSPAFLDLISNMCSEIVIE